MNQPMYRPPTSGGHITVVETVYHQRPGKDPDACEIGFVRRLKSGDQLTKQELAVGKDKINLDCRKSSMVVIENRNNVVRTINPTEKQSTIERIATVLIYCNDVLFTQTPVGERARFVPIDGQVYAINCNCGIANVEIKIYPE